MAMDNLQPPSEPCKPTPDPGVAQNLGAFFGHIIRGFKTPVQHPEEAESHKVEVERTVTERTEGNLTIRETIIREIEVRQSDPPAAKGGNP